MPTSTVSQTAEGSAAFQSTIRSTNQLVQSLLPPAEHQPRPDSDPLNIQAGTERPMSTTQSVPGGDSISVSDAMDSTTSTERRPETHEPTAGEQAIIAIDHDEAFVEWLMEAPAPDLGGDSSSSSPLEQQSLQERSASTQDDTSRIQHPLYANLYITRGPSAHNNDCECPICQETITPISETLTHGTCQYSFCRECLETWLAGGNTTCPCDREELVPRHVGRTGTARSRRSRRRGVRAALWQEAEAESRRTIQASRARETEHRHATREIEATLTRLTLETEHQRTPRARGSVEADLQILARAQELQLVFLSLALRPEVRERLDHHIWSLRTLNPERAGDCATILFRLALRFVHGRVALGTRDELLQDWAEHVRRANPDCPMSTAQQIVNADLETIEMSHWFGHGLDDEFIEYILHRWEEDGSVRRYFNIPEHLFVLRHTGARTPANLATTDMDRWNCCCSRSRPIRLVSGR